MNKKLYKIQSDELKERLKVKENVDNLNLEFNKETLGDSVSTSNSQ